MPGPNSSISKRAGWIATAAFVAGLGGALCAAPAHALTVVVDDFATQFTTNPLLCGAAGCQAHTTELGISPTGTVNRRATIDESVADSNPNNIDVRANTFSGGASFVTSQLSPTDFSIGSLSLDYLLSGPLVVSAVDLNVVTSPTSDTFDIAIFYNKNNTFVFANNQTIPANANYKYTFKFKPHALTDEILIVYNPITANGSSFSLGAQAAIPYAIPTNFFHAPPNSGIDAKVLGPAVARGRAAGAAPEPGVWALMTLGFGSIGAVLRRRKPATCAG